MQHLARLGVAPLVELHRLPDGQHLECLDRELRPEGRELIGGDDRVPAEQRGEPRNAGGHISLATGWAVVHQEAQVGQAAAHCQVEQLVVCLDRRGATRPRPVGAGALVLRHARWWREKLRGIRRGSGRLPGPCRGGTVTAHAQQHCGIGPGAATTRSLIRPDQPLDFA